MSNRDKALSEELRERAYVCHARGDYPSWKAMNKAANRLAQIERENLLSTPNNATVEGKGK